MAIVESSPVADPGVPEPDAEGEPPAPEWGPWRWVFVAMVAGSVLVGVVLRFAARSPLWLDEALSVNIARLPLGEIGGALRQDGHPPLYYWLLHVWMDIFGTGTEAVRAFSGVWSLALFPLMWVAARRLGGVRVAWFATILLALSPYAIRYGSETRMYVMVSVLALAGWLVIDDARTRPTAGRLVAIGAITSALLWSHYWSMWLLAAGGGLLAIHAWRSRADDADRRATLRIMAAMVVGGLTFIPWVPTLLYQGAHTGTPWARPLRPTEMVTNTLADFGGGPLAETILLGWMLALLMLTGLFGRALDRVTIAIDLRTRPEGRPFAILTVVTLAIAAAASYATGATYASRYASVFFPFLLLLAALGVQRFQSRPIVISVLAVLMVFGAFGGFRTAVDDRSDARRSAEAITAQGTAGDWVAYCPDQLGPATSRMLGPGFEQVTYPAFAPPQRVDWVDYDARLAQASADRFADELVARSAGRKIFLVYSTTYTTHKETCQQLFNGIANRGRVATVLTQPSEAYEGASVAQFEVAQP